jgi:large subunit ribosomal protein L25
MDPVGARRLVSQLPPKLLNFFIKYPPRDPLIKTIYSSDDKAISIARKLHDFQPVPPSLFQPLSSTHITAAGTERPIVYLPFRNPFKAHKDLRSGNFHGPVYSLRRQADLIKLAIRYGVVDLLPPSEKMQKMLWGMKKPMSGTLRSKGSYEERNRAVYVENKQAKLEEALRIVQLRNTVPPYQYPHFTALRAPLCIFGLTFLVAGVTEDKGEETKTAIRFHRKTIPTKVDSHIIDVHGNANTFTFQ